MGFQKDKIVTVIIPIKNSANAIQRVIESLRAHVRVNYEVIVVDSLSTDGTAFVAEKLGALVISAEVGRSEARNMGARLANGTYLLFLDSDMEVFADIISDCISMAERTDAHAVIIPELSYGHGIWARVRMQERMGYRGGSKHATPAFVRRDVFMSLGGFDPDLVAGEDYDFDTRLRAAGFKIAEIERPLLHNENGLTFPKYMMKSFYYGEHMSTFVKKHPNEILTRFNPIRTGAIASGIRTKVPGPIPKENQLTFILVPYFKLAQMVFTILGILKKTLSES